MNDPKADKAETKPLVKISNKVIEIEEYESVMRQSRKVLTRMDEVLDNSTNITPEETSDWKEFWKNLKDSSILKILFENPSYFINKFSMIKKIIFLNLIF